MPIGCPALVQPVQDKPLEWGHFSSRDLVHWTEHPEAIAPTQPYDGSIIDTGAVFQHPNGTMLALYATSNITSNLGTGAFDGDLCLAVARDANLTTWDKICSQPNGRIVNPTCHWCRESCPQTCAANVNSTAPSPFPGIAARMAHRDPTAPWLDDCEPGSSIRCWYALSGSGGQIDGKRQSAMLLWKTDYLISTEWVFVKIFFSHPTSASVYSCPDFFRLPSSDTFVFGSLDGDYFLGNYTPVAASAGKGPTFTAHSDVPSGSFSGLGIWKSGGDGANNVVSGSSRRIFWGTAGWTGGYPIPSRDPEHMDKLHVGSVAALARDLTLTPDGNLGISFVPELQALRVASSYRHADALEPGSYMAGFNSTHAEIIAEFNSTQAAHGVIILGGRGVPSPYIGFDPVRATLSIYAKGGSSVAFTLKPNEGLRLHVYVDSGIIEVVANGRVSIAAAIPIPTSLQAAGGVAAYGVAAQLDVWSLASIW